MSELREVKAELEKLNRTVEDMQLLLADVARDADRIVKLLERKLKS